jgi:uncharacterized protein (DUF983 family)
MSNQVNENHPGAFSSFVQCKCPQCRVGKVFTHGLWNPFAFYKSNDHCPECGVKFEQETGFYWTAMYISYAFSTGLMLVLGIIMVTTGMPLFDDWRYFVAFLGVILLQVPFSFRYSRMLSLYLIAPYKRYKPDYKSLKNS